MRWLLLLAAVGCAVGCGGKRAAAPTPATTPAPAAVSVGPPVTAEEAAEFADELEIAVSAGDSEAVVRLLRLRQLVNRSAADLGLPADMVAGVRQGAGAAMTKMADVLVEQSRDGGQYELVRVRTHEGRPSVVFRALRADMAVNYHELPLVRYPDGVGPSDMLVAVTGEPLSSTFRRMLARVAAEAGGGLLARLSGAERLYLDNMPTVQAMSEHVRAGRQARALAAYHTLPAALRTDKTVLVVALTAAGAGDDAEYLRLMELFRTTYPTDPALDLMSIDYHFVRKEYPLAVAGVDRLDKQVGGDPYLDLLRSFAHARGGDPAAALAAADRLVAWRPSSFWGYNAGATAMVLAKRYPEALGWYKRGVEAGALEVDLGVIRTDDDFAAFRRSPQFAELEEWLTERAAKKPADPDR